MVEDEGPVDVIVVGGGPVGLHAALKAAVLNQSAILVDKGRRFSRVSQAAAIANLPGHSSDVSGGALLEEGRRKLAEFQDRAGKRLVRVLEDTEAVTASRDADGTFRVRVRPADGDGDAREIRGRVLVLATGLVDRKPGIDAFYRRGHATLSPYVHEGGVGYCILCEGWLVEGKRVAVIGWTPSSASIAADLSRHFHGNTTLLTDGPRTEVDTDRLGKAGVTVDARVIERVMEDDGRVGVAFENGERARFDKAFFTLGWYKVMNELAVQLGAATTPDGYVKTNGNSEVVDADGNLVPGLFAVGDLRADRWKQIVIGWGDAETAMVAAFAERLPD